MAAICHRSLRCVLRGSELGREDGENNAAAYERKNYLKATWLKGFASSIRKSGGSLRLKLHGRHFFRSLAFGTSREVQGSFRDHPRAPGHWFPCSLHAPRRRPRSDRPRCPKVSDFPALPNFAGLGNVRKRPLPAARRGSRGNLFQNSFEFHEM